MNENLIKANSYYRQAQSKTGVSRVLKRSYLEKALRIYHEELKEHLTAAEPLQSRAAIWRNIAMANLRLGDVIDDLQPKAELELVVHHLKDAVAGFITALTFRPNDVFQEWGIQVEERIMECFEVAFRRTRDTVDDGTVTMILKSSIIDFMFQGFPENDHRFKKILVKARVAKAEFFFHSAVICLAELNFRGATQYLEYAREETELASSVANKFRIQNNDINVIEQDMYMLRCSCDSVRLRFQADELFHAQVHESEEINFDMMWDIVDIYKEAVLLTREMDIENEAIALTCLGRVFYKILKIRDKGHHYYRRAFDLAQTLLPKDINKLQWYVEAKDTIQEYQKFVLREEEKREQEINAPILKKLAPQLDELKNVHSSGDLPKYLKFLYSKYPPKVKYEFKEAEMQTSNLRKYLMKAITHYHPDRQVSFGIEWKVFCNEITKFLTISYESFK